MEGRRKGGRDVTSLALVCEHSHSRGEPPHSLLLVHMRLHTPHQQVPVMGVLVHGVAERLQRRRRGRGRGGGEGEGDGVERIVVDGAVVVVGSGGGGRVFQGDGVKPRACCLGEGGAHGRRRRAPLRHRPGVRGGGFRQWEGGHDVAEHPAGVLDGGIGELVGLQGLEHRLWGQCAECIRRETWCEGNEIIEKMV